MMYLYAGCGVATIASLTLFGWVLYRAGRNAARVRSEAKDVATANEESAASQRALAARTNGIRSDNDLFGTLDKGDF